MQLSNTTKKQIDVIANVITGLATLKVSIEHLAKDENEFDECENYRMIRAQLLSRYEMLSDDVDELIDLIARHFANEYYVNYVDGLCDDENE